MIKLTAVSLMFLFFPSYLAAQTFVLKAGIKITKSGKIKSRQYFLAPAPGGEAAILIEGEGITIDFADAVIRGNSAGQLPDEYRGIGILIRNSRKVTIKNLRISGYKLALVARNVEELTIENSDLSYNYRPRLQSSRLKEDVSDWLSYHQNDQDEWLRYGAGIYLRNCRKAVVRHCVITGNQNALLMSGCEESLICNNDFSFNSGLGIGLYRSSSNQILYNRLIFNIRGYSHGIYQRGQDSAGILVFEQSSRNLFFKNNATHGGDGFFLWAGQTTMDTGQGGCNDNLLIGNDFSYAATNGIETTFSRNFIARNRLLDCENGIWAGYSFESVIRDNRFANNKTGIAIEHGQDNILAFNLFSKDQVAIKLWGREQQPGDWGYARVRDTRSRDYILASNSFNGNPVVFDLKRTARLNVFSNIYSGDGILFRTDSTVSGLDSSLHYELVDRAEKDTSVEVAAVPEPDPFKGTGKWAGRRQIRMTEWGPYDFRYPLIWHQNPADTSGWMDFEVLGPKGKWRVKWSHGLDSLSGTAGTFPAVIRAKRSTPLADLSGIDLELEYSGPAFTDVFGLPQAKGRPHIFRFREEELPLEWQVAWYRLDTAYYNPLREKGLFSPTVRMAPLKTDSAGRLDYAWWGGIKVADQVYSQFITLANSKPLVAAGRYRLSVTWQGAIRLYAGEKLALEEWRIPPEGADEAQHRDISIELTENQNIRVEFLGLGGFSALSVKLKRED